MELPIFLFNQQLVTDEDMNSDITSSSVDISEARSICAQIYWSGTSPIGNFYIQGSNDDNNWANASSASAVSGNSGSLLINLDAPAFRFARIYYDNTSGTGTLQGLLSAKR